MGKRINVSLHDDAGAALQEMFEQVNAKREAKGLPPVFMRDFIGSCILRCHAMETVFLCGELLTKTADSE